MKAPEDAYSASAYGAYRHTSDITCALIEGPRDNAFIVKVPDGEYTVWAVANDQEWAPPLYEIWANGQKKLDVRLPRACFVLCEPFTARATDGLLRIELKGPHGWLLSGLVIGQGLSEKDEVIAKMQDDIFFLTDAEKPGWKPARQTPANPPLEWTAAEKEKGYIAYAADYMEAMIPKYEPTRAAVGGPMSAFATAGEFEPATFGITSLKDLDNVQVELGDFVAEQGGQKIGKENVTVGIARQQVFRLSGWGAKGDYATVPATIEPPVGRACNVQAGQAKQWWLTVKVPENTPAGKYRMTLTVRPANAPATTMQVAPARAAVQTDPPDGQALGPLRGLVAADRADPRAGTPRAEHPGGE